MACQLTLVTNMMTQALNRPNFIVRASIVMVPAVDMH